MGREREKCKENDHNERNHRDSLFSRLGSLKSGGAYLVKVESTSKSMCPMQASSDFGLQSYRTPAILKVKEGNIAQSQSSGPMGSDRIYLHGSQDTHFHLYFIIPLRSLFFRNTFSPCSQVLGKNLVLLTCDVSVKQGCRTVGWGQESERLRFILARYASGACVHSHV